MLFRIFLLLVTVPTLEVYLLLRVGTRLGAWPTFGLILVTGALGAKLAHSQGLQILTSIQRELQQGRLPAEQLLDGLCVLIAGVVLVTPGFLTDLLGFALLVPSLRRLFQRRILKLFWNPSNYYASSGSGKNTSENSGEIKTNWRVDSEELP